MKRFQATIREGRGRGAWVEIPFDVHEVFGTRGQVKVKASFDGHPYRGSLAPMGGGKHVLGIRKDIREAIGKTVGDRVTISVARDTEERRVTLPAELEAALATSRRLRTEFDRLSYTNRRELAEGIAKAKKPETRARRLEATLARLTGARTPR